MQFLRVDKKHAKISRLGYGGSLHDIYANRAMDEMGRRVLVAEVAHFAGQKRILMWIDETGDDHPDHVETFGFL